MAACSKLPAGVQISRGDAEHIIEVLKQGLSHHPGSDALLMPMMAAEKVLLLELDDNIDRLEELWRLVSTPACRFGPLSRSSVGGDLISWAQFSPGHQDAPVDCYETCCRGRAWSDAGLTQILVCLGA